MKTKPRPQRSRSSVSHSHFFKKLMTFSSARPRLHSHKGCQRDSNRSARSESLTPDKALTSVYRGLFRGHGSSVQITRMEAGWNSAPLFGRVVVVTQSTRQFPRPVFVLPQVHETPFTRSVDRLSLWMQKPVHAHFDGPITLHVVDLQRPWHQHALCVSGADIVLDTLSQLFSTESHSALVVVKLHVFV
jgi:hypothetical protein